FIYFFFAVGGWIKGLFEAMIGAPLWALAHIRIDGEGLPGNAAMNGYFLIFEGFLRPILIVFGMLASISIFAALVNVLNSIFNLIAQNAGGYDMKSQLMDASFSGEYMRSLIDQFFFTVIYTIIVYMIGMSCFKLIDQIPNNILRWMGQAVSSFGDQREDPAQGLTSRASIGSQQVLGKLGGGLQGLSSSAIGK
ncbi:MAG: DotA/TraY family protein, partial [Alphaproteobacteria bacterium]|nr:DotA/TraY family protein [Alphaproteobacteria bacterium]